MRIALSGSHGTGKTSVFKHLQSANKLQGYHFIASPTRRVKALENTPFPYFCLSPLDIQQYLIINSAVSSYEDNIVMDRCLLDTLAYTWFIQGLDGKHPLIEEYGYRALYHAVELGLKLLPTLEKFDYIFYFPPRFELVPDGERWTEYQLEIHELILSFANQAKVHLWHIPDGLTIEERTEFIINHLGGK